jgi:hypothetical protein
MRRYPLLAGITAGLAAALLPTAPGFAADSSASGTPPVKLVIKPLLCVIDKDATSCAVTFDIRWKSPQPAEYCLNDSVQSTPLRCWPRTLAGEMKQERVVSEEFRYWLSPPAGGLTQPAGTERLSEVKIEVLRVGSDDRRRERRTRHVWDVL